MEYISTRGDERGSATAAILKGQADGGGLFAPTSFPPYFPKDLAELSYIDVACAVLSLYLVGDGGFTEDEVEDCCKSAYGAGFDDPKIAPLADKGGELFLELFHGKTQAFKDMALSILPRLMAIAKKKLRVENEICILTATSGDTGGAALAGFAGVAGFRALAFYPLGGVSEVQRLQMVGRAEGNVRAIAVRGNFDDAQRGVKAIFADNALKEELNASHITLSSANSINIGRLLPQIAYYYYAYGQAVATDVIKQGDRIDFAVPTGNFGNILAGWYAGRMGLPIGELLCASNENAVLYDFFNSGIYDANRPFVQTSSPSMDILISSNLERLLYHLSGSDYKLIGGLMEDLARLGRYAFSPGGAGIAGGFAREEEAFAAARAMFDMGYIIDPHTAVALAAKQKRGAASGRRCVVIATASPYKFEPALKRGGVILDMDSAPPGICNLFNTRVSNERVCDIGEMKAAVADFAR